MQEDKSKKPNKAKTASGAKSRFGMEIKAISETGEFEGQLSVYNVVDLGSDLVEPGAFTKSIQERGTEIPLLWQHKSDKPIGTLVLMDGPDALRVKGKLLMELDDAKKAYLLIKNRVIKGLSIGFDTIKSVMEGAVRHLKEVRLWEGSIVTFPMLEQAFITAVKAREEQKDDFNEELAERQLRDAFSQMMDALYESLLELTWDRDTASPDKLTQAQVIIEQFSAAYLSYLPQYLDLLDAWRLEYAGKEPSEGKAGRTFSAKTRAAIQKCMDTHEAHCKSIDELKALMSDEAGEATSDDKAAAKPENTKTADAGASHSENFDEVGEMYATLLTNELKNRRR